MKEEQLKAENERLKQWNRQFYDKVHHYFFDLLTPWKEAPVGSSERRKLTSECRKAEREIMSELNRIDNAMSRRKTDAPAYVDKATAVQTELEI